MKVGVIGYPLVGKSALYRAAAQGQAKGEVTAVPVPDPRFDRIVAQVQPKKQTPATVILHDDIEAVDVLVAFLDIAQRNVVGCRIAVPVTKLNPAPYDIMISERAVVVLATPDVHDDFACDRAKPDFATMLFALGVGHFHRHLAVGNGHRHGQ